MLSGPQRLIPHVCHVADQSGGLQGGNLLLKGLSRLTNKGAVMYPRKRRSSMALVCPASLIMQRLGPRSWMWGQEKELIIGAAVSWMGHIWLPLRQWTPGLEPQLL